MKKIILSAFVVLALLGIGFNQSAYSLLPPDVYKEKIEKSKIKAIAIVKIIELINKDQHKTEKKITFSLEKGLVKGVPEKFTGICFSVDEDTQKPLMGPLKYYYPEVGDEVYVTISKNGGNITSYQKLTPELKKQLEENNI